MRQIKKPFGSCGKRSIRCTEGDYHWVTIGVQPLDCEPSLHGLLRNLAVSKVSKCPYVLITLAGTVIINRCEGPR